MKKKIAVFVLVFGIIQNLIAQNNTFILIDISGNPTNAPASVRISVQERKEAIDIAQGIIKQDLDISNYPKWSVINADDIVTSALNKAKNPILRQNDILVVMPYGEKETYRRFKLFNSYPDVNIKEGLEFAQSLSYTDQWTFAKIANAKAADIAIDANLQSYYLIEISGLGGDKTGSQIMTQSENEMINLFESSVIIEPIGMFQKEGKEYRVSVRKIQIKNAGSNQNTSGSKGIITAENVKFKQLRIISPIGSKSNPQTIEEDQGLLVSWMVMGQEPNTTYTVIATNINNNKRVVKRCTNCNNIRLELEPGTYSMQINGDKMPQCQNNNQVVKVKGSPSFGILWFLIIMAIIVGGIFYIRKKDPFGWFGNKREKKKNEDENDNDDYINLNI